MYKRFVINRFSVPKTDVWAVDSPFTAVRASPVKNENSTLINVMRPTHWSGSSPETLKAEYFKAIEV